MHQGIDGESAVSVTAELYRRLEALALEQRTTMCEIVARAVEMQFGEGPSLARSRLIDRLARLEAGFGDPDELHDQIRREARLLRTRPPWS